MRTEGCVVDLSGLASRKLCFHEIVLSAVVVGHLLVEIRRADRVAARQHPRSSNNIGDDSAKALALGGCGPRGVIDC
eukprot:4645071-Prymnesium_polylepis.1